MINAVLLLDGAGEFVFFDAALDIIIHCGAAHQTGLGAAIHDQSVNVIMRAIILHQNVFRTETLQIGP